MPAQPILRHWTEPRKPHKCRHKWRNGPVGRQGTSRAEKNCKCCYKRVRPLGRSPLSLAPLCRSGGLECPGLADDFHILLLAVIEPLHDGLAKPLGALLQAALGGATRVDTDDQRAAIGAALAQALADIRCGDPLDGTVRMGPLFNAAAVERYQRDIASARQVGETILPGQVLGGHPCGNVVTPALYAVQDRDHRLVQEELFAPIGILERFTSEDEAVLSANATRYGLAASVHTSDHARARRVARALKSGTVWINCHNRLFAEAETGGFRESGLGRLHGLEGLADFMETKHIYAEYGHVPTG